jgi:frataxin-like iron-binding protein CyaY
MGLKDFFMPRARGDRALADVGRLFIQKAEPLKDQFIASRLPQDFIDRLRTSIESIEHSIEQQAASKAARKEATTAIATIRTEAVQLLARLDPIMENLTNGNEPLKAVWLAARRIDKAATRRAARAAEAGSPPAAA